MIFARKVWHLLVAIKDGLVLLILLGFFMLLYAALTARPGAASVTDGALLMRLNGAVVEELAVIDPIQRLLAATAPTSEYRARDIVRALRLAAKDNRIKAVALDLTRFTGGGLVHMQEIGAALDMVRAAKKPSVSSSTASRHAGSPETVPRPAASSASAARKAPMRIAALAPLT